MLLRGAVLIKIFYAKYIVKTVVKFKEDFFNQLMDYFKEVCNQLSTTYNMKDNNIMFVTLGVEDVAQKDICSFLFVVIMFN